MDIQIVSASFLALIPVVIGVVAVVRKVGLARRYAPLASIVIGILGCSLLGGSWTEVILAGVIVGLSASGLYSGTKTTVK